jgi:hypothetical protein
MDKHKQDQLTKLIERTLYDEASEAEIADLESVIMQDDEALKLYQDVTLQHSLLESSNALHAVSEVETTGQSVVWKVAAVAAVILLTITVIMQRSPETFPEHYAAITETSMAQWGECSVPTTVGTELHEGRLELLHGTATVTFSSGAIVSIEAPAALDLVSEMKAVVKYGRVVAEVPKRAIGFRLDTPDMEVKDLGTVFSVYVDPVNSKSRVDVIDGEVEIFHEHSQGKKLLFTNQGVRLSNGSLEFSETKGEITRPSSAAAPQGRMIITTAEGLGGHSTIISDHAESHLHPHLLLVKNPINKLYTRKLYLKFDLSSLRGKSPGKVSLQLTQMESPYGYASFLSDCNFTVYALNDGATDYWDSAKMGWADAPANLKNSGDGVVGEQVVELGNFTIPKGQQFGEILLDSSYLKQAIESDTNGLLSLVIVRNTKELRAEGMVHAFAGNHTPAAEPPRLIVELE